MVIGQPPCPNRPAVFYVTQSPQREVVASRSMAVTCGGALAEEFAGRGTAANLRLHFRRRFATTPTAYRRAFGRGGA